MNKREFESTTFGAEALPGGLADIKRSLGHEAAAPRSAQAPAPKPRVVGLLALARRWLGRKARRRP
jgi:hypothetical protein